MFTRRLHWIITGVCLLTALVFAFDLTPWVRGGYGWRWEYLPVALTRGLPLAVGLAVYVAGAAWLLTRTRRPGYALLWGLTGTVGLALLVASAREGDSLYFLVTRVMSLPSSSEWWLGATIDWQGGAALRDWTGIMQELAPITSNAGTSPPGIPLLYALTADLIGRSPALSTTLYQALLPYQCHNYAFLTFTPAQWAAAWLGILTPLWAGLAVVPLYGLSRRLLPGIDARLPVLWWALVPGILAFTTSSSTVFPVIALVVLWLLDRGLQGRAHPHSIDHVEITGDRSQPRHHQQGRPGGGVPSLLAAGMVYGCGLFLNFIFLPLAALYGFYTLLHYARIDRQRGASILDPVIVGLWFGIGTLIPWAIFFAVAGQTPLDLLTVSLDTHFDLERPYGYWVWMHLWDWAIFTGLPLVLFWLARFRQPGSASPANRGGLLSLALLLTLLAFTLSGTTRGESGRIWLALSPFALLAAAGAFSGDGLRRAWLPLTITQAGLTLVLVSVLAVYNAPDLTRAPDAPSPDATGLRPVDVRFNAVSGAGFRLIGWDAVSVDAGAAINLRLQWQGLDRPGQVYWFGAVLVAPDGATYPVDAWQPGGATPYPTTCWRPGTVIGDEVRLPLPDQPLPGDWYLSLAVYGDPAAVSVPDGRLTVTLPDGSTDRQIGLGPVVVP